MVTDVKPNAAVDLTTVEAVKDFLSIDNTADDRVLQRLVTSCSFSAQNFLNRNLLSASYTEQYDGNGKRRLPVKQTPITAVSSLVINMPAFPWSYGQYQNAPGPMVGGTTVPLSPDGAQSQPGYDFDSNTIFLCGYTFAKGIQNVWVTYTAGYSAVPLDVEEAIVEWVADRYRFRGRVGEKSKALPQGGSVSYETGFLPDRVKGSLSNYKRQIPL
jgi:hypothetical protein